MTTWIAELEEYAGDTGLPWARAAAEFGRALAAADPSGANGHFQGSLVQHAQADRPYDRARVQLAYGEHLRRHQQRVEARRHLRAALETFTDLRAAPLAERAAQELRASGETARKRDASTLVDLTPMELKVAGLVSPGLSNKDVAAQCWISPADRGLPPAQRLHQDRRHLPRRARAARPRLTSTPDPIPAI